MVGRCDSRRCVGESACTSGVLTSSLIAMTIPPATRHPIQPYVGGTCPGIRAIPDAPERRLGTAEPCGGAKTAWYSSATRHRCVTTDRMRGVAPQSDVRRAGAEAPHARPPAGLRRETRCYSGATLGGPTRTSAMTQSWRAAGYSLPPVGFLGNERLFALTVRRLVLARLTQNPFNQKVT